MLRLCSCTRVQFVDAEGHTSTNRFATSRSTCVRNLKALFQGYTSLRVSPISKAYSKSASLHLSWRQSLRKHLRHDHRGTRAALKLPPPRKAKKKGSKRRSVSASGRSTPKKVLQPARPGRLF